MGKKHKRGSQSFGADLHRVTSNTSSTNLSPKTPAARHKAGSGSFRSVASSGQPSPEKELSKGIENFNINKTLPGVQLPDLPFRSFKNGTLITNNGEPTVLPATTPLSAATTISSLSAASPSFVPVIPSPRQLGKPIYTSRPISLPTPPAPGFQKLQNLLQDMRSSPTHGYGGYAAGSNDGHYTGNNDGYSGYSGVYGYAQQKHGPTQSAGAIGRYPTPPGPIGGRSRIHTPSPGPSSVHSYESAPRGPRNPGTFVVQPAHDVQTFSQRPTREFLARKDRGKKDILVTADGITRNHVRIIERQLPNGIPYQSYHEDFEPPKYNFVEDFKAMTVEEKEIFLAKNLIDVLVQIKSVEEQNELAATELGGKTGEAKAKKGKGKNKSKVKEAKDIKETMEVKDVSVENDAKDASEDALASILVAKREGRLWKYLCLTKQTNTQQSLRSMSSNPLVLSLLLMLSA